MFQGLAAFRTQQWSTIRPWSLHISSPIHCAFLGNRLLLKSLFFLYSLHYSLHYSLKFMLIINGKTLKVTYAWINLIDLDCNQYDLCIRKCMNALCCQKNTVVILGYLRTYKQPNTNCLSYKGHKSIIQTQTRSIHFIQPIASFCWQCLYWFLHLCLKFAKGLWKQNYFSAELETKIK